MPPLQGGVSLHLLRNTTAPQHFLISLRSIPLPYGLSSPLEFKSQRSGIFVWCALVPTTMFGRQEANICSKNKRVKMWEKVSYQANIDRVRSRQCSHFAGSAQPTLG